MTDVSAALPPVQKAQLFSHPGRENRLLAGPHGGSAPVKFGMGPPATARGRAPAVTAHSVVKHSSVWIAKAL